MIKLGHEFGGELVNEKEIRELLGKDMSRSAKQVIDLISRRQDYVQKNVETVQKQVDAAEEKLNKVLVISNPSLEDEGGAPLMDIREELDEDGNVISSSVSHPGQQTAQIMETLKKAGIELPEESAEDETSTQDLELSSAANALSKEAEKPQQQPSSKTVGKAPMQAESSSASPKPEPIRRKKSVTFTPDTKEAADASGLPQMNASFTAHMNFKPGSRVIELNEKDEMVRAEVAGPQNPRIQDPVIPKDESEEDAKLRREMLEYNLNEVGHVVAELDLYEGDSDDEDMYEDEDSDIEEVEEEDEWGRSRPVITEEYLQKMRELEKKLDARMIENLGPAPEDADLNNMLQQAQGVHKLVVRTDEEIPPALLPKQSTHTKARGSQEKSESSEKAPVTESTPGASKSEKGVRFASELDVSSAPAVKPPSPPASSTTTIAPEPRPIADAIIERTPIAPAPPTPSQPAPPRKTSRFKSGRANPPPHSTPSTATTTTATPTLTASSLPHRPTGPANATLASSIVERDTAANSPASAPDPDGLDPDTLSQEALSSYHRLRAKLIQRQEGGFTQLDPEEEAEGPLVEEREDGSVRKVSRFRAARVKGPGMGP
ncbi:hypothetical protein MPH_10050 [Macrophomina phaseolina MS6]|uniref:DUF3835 domain-containing protein n=1 Tax=Macrophomina phaseolina (strain MS6) TaxID=1126212 RepID=K2RIT8_MACPH|nr:hypothetical protein MPH_10050 [Macrophomina phaseolina MS6]